jgi:predicted AlkP superfamily pyrophosphatase or phosphodiesterase
MKFDFSSVIIFNLVSLLSSQKIERVLFIGLDGAGSFHKQINSPNINGLLQSGVYCDYGSAMDPTMSGENWGSMIHGVIPSKHGLNNNIASSKPYPEDSAYPSVFKIIHQNDQDAKMASFALWPAINNGIIELSVPVHRVTKASDDVIIGDMLNYLRTDGKESKLLFYYFGDIDNTGHSSSWLSTKYRQRYIKTDGYIKQILETLDELKLRESTLIVITADHGGILFGHGGKTKSERNILFGISGPNIPKKKLPDHSVKNMDTAAIILKSLNITLPENFDAKYPTL